MSDAGTDWGEQLRRLVDAVRPPEGDAAGHAGAHTGAECRWCPLCQAVAVLRGERPEVTAALADVLATAAAALRQFAGEPPDGGAEDGAPAGGPPAADPGDAAPPVQRIDLT